MSVTNFGLQLRPATLDDATLVSDLESLRDPSDPRDPVLLRHWWAMGDEQEKAIRRIAVRDGTAVAYVGAAHELWHADEKRFGTVRPMLRYDLWNEDLLVELVRVGEDWLALEGAAAVVVRVREDFTLELAALNRIGYREDRRMWMSELDLVAQRDHILAAVEKCRRQMEEQGVHLHPISEDPDPDRYRKLYEMWTESEKDIPTTVPWRVITFDEWRRFWFENPAIREEWFWIAREGEAIVGASVLDRPVVRGVPWTAYTGTARSVRGRGIARALKYETMAQAITVGYTRVRTNNDADNPPILKINADMGYKLIAPIIELHRKLS